MQQLQAATVEVPADLPHGHGAAADLDELVGAEEDLLRGVAVGEEGAERQRDAVEDALEQPHGGVGLAGFDEGDHRVRHAGSPGEFALGEPVRAAYASQALADAGVVRLVHGRHLFSCSIS